MSVREEIAVKAQAALDVVQGGGTPTRLALQEIIDLATAEPTGDADHYRDFEKPEVVYTAVQNKDGGATLTDEAGHTSTVTKEKWVNDFEDTTNN